MTTRRRCRDPTTSSRVPIALLWISLLGCALIGASASAQMVRRGADTIELQTLPTLFDDEVRDQLESGLTTTFRIALSVRDGGGGRVEGEGWLALRYELWDEVFLAETGGLLGARRFQLEDLEALDAWWRAPPDARLAASDLDPSAEWRAVLDVELIPFSANEQQDARDWMARTLGGKTGGGEASGAPVQLSAPNARDDALGSVLRLLLATSIRPDPLRSVRTRFRLPAPLHEEPVS